MAIFELAPRISHIGKASVKRMVKSHEVSTYLPTKVRQSSSRRRCVRPTQDRG